MGRWLTAILGLLTACLSLFRERQARQDGATATEVKIDRETVHEIQVANDARGDVERELAAHPGLVRAPDEFERPA